MKKNYYTELSHRYIFSLFHSIKKKKSGIYRDHRHSVAELGLILDGFGEYLLGNKTFTAEPDSLFIVRSNEYHCIPTVTSDSLIGFNIQLSSYFLWNVCSDYIPTSKLQALINPDIEIDNKINTASIIKKFKEIADIYQSDAKSNALIIRKKVLELIILLAEEVAPEENTAITMPARIDDIHAALSFIRENYMKPITIEDIARSATMSPSYMSGIFKTVTGVSPYNYLSLTRIEKAVELLKYSKKSIVNIALECGFTNITSFNKMFKQLVGLTPTDLRKSYNDANT